MKISKVGIKLIQSYEKCVLKAYRDAGGVLTCGWGSTGPDIKSYTTWTQEQADERFEQDIEKREVALTEMLGDAPTTQEQFDAMLSLGYNIGMGALRNSTVLKKHKEKDYKGAAAAFLYWCKVNHKTLEGLLRRRKAEAELYLTQEHDHAVNV